MNVLLIPDKFKGSLSAKEVINALAQGIRTANPKTRIYEVIASDGGDGFLEAVATYVKVEEIFVATVDPLGRDLCAPYLYERDTRTAYIELAKASGMELLNALERDPVQCSTLGTGLQIKHAINRGATTIYVGLGGSATNDGGIGIAKALGFEFLDIAGCELKPTGVNLRKIDRIRPAEIPKMLKVISVYAVNDVSNPLYGEDGAAYVYARQKGAEKEEIELLDNGLRHLDKKVRQQFAIKNASKAGAGAAGGTAYGLKTFADARFISGIDFILQLAGVAKLLKKESMDYIITGEGKIDEQTLSGKLINGVLNLGKEHSIPVVAICGALEVDRGSLKGEGIFEVLEVGDRTKSLEYNMKNASQFVERAICDFIRGNA